MSNAVKFAAAAAVAATSLVALASASTKTVDLDGFSYIDASAGVDVIVKVGGGYSIRAEGEDEALEHLRIEKRGDTLEIGREHRRGLVFSTHKGRLTVHVTMPALNGVDVSSGADVTATGIDSERFSASVSSGADATLSGRCGDLTADGSSGADLEASDLKCENANADVSSGADLDIYASESVIADASSGGDITVHGGPKNTNIDKSSGGGVTILK
ncbi:MAG: head GIN domain-containing protein [Parvularculaceae bacterium]